MTRSSTRKSNKRRLSKRSRRVRKRSYSRYRALLKDFDEAAAQEVTDSMSKHTMTPAASSQGYITSKAKEPEDMRSLGRTVRVYFEYRKKNINKPIVESIVMDQPIDTDVEKVLKVIDEKLRPRVSTNATTTTYNFSQYPPGVRERLLQELIQKGIIEEEPLSTTHYQVHPWLLQ